MSEANQAGEKPDAPLPRHSLFDDIPVEILAAQLERARLSREPAHGTTAGSEFLPLTDTVGKCCVCKHRIGRPCRF